jgi:uncharacterized protein YkwD
MQTLRPPFRHLIAVAVLLALAACGGGGGGTDAPTQPSTPSDVAPAAGTLQSSVSPLTYTAGSVQESAFAALNQARQRAGVGLLAQSTQIDVAAQAHASYINANQTVTHDEVATGVGYYEATPASRVAKSGFVASSASEVIGGTGISRQGSGCTVGLLNTLYHGATMLSSFTHAGVGTTLDGLGVPMCVINLASEGTKTYGQVMPSGTFGAYPYDGQTGLFETFYAGYEIPRPPVSLFPNLMVGTPVHANVRNADYLNFRQAGTLSLTVTQFELRDAAGNLVDAHIMAEKAAKAGAGVTLNADTILPDGSIVLIPKSPLLKGQTYTARFSATLKAGGTPLTKTWTFTTNP